MEEEPELSIDDPYITTLHPPPLLLTFPHMAMLILTLTRTHNLTPPSTPTPPPRHLEAMSKSVQHIDLEVTRALAYQEGLQAGQRAAAASSYLWGSALLAAAVGGSVGLVLMRSKLRG